MFKLLRSGEVEGRKGENFQNMMSFVFEAVEEVQQDVAQHLAVKLTLYCLKKLIRMVFEEGQQPRNHFFRRGTG